MNTKNSSKVMIYNIQEEANPEVVSAYAEDLDSMPDLYQEYKSLVDELKRQGRRQDTALLMRLTIVMVDLGIYRPSPP